MDFEILMIRDKWEEEEWRRGEKEEAIRAELFWCDATADCHVRRAKFGFPLRGMMSTSGFASIPFDS